MDVLVRCREQVPVPLAIEAYEFRAKQPPVYDQLIDRLAITNSDSPQKRQAGDPHVALRLLGMTSLLQR